MAFREIQGQPCAECETPGLAICKRCRVSLCARHTPKNDQRCETCERVRRDKLAILDMQMDLLAEGKRMSLGVTAMGLAALSFGVPMAVKLPFTGWSLLLAGFVVTAIGAVSVYRAHTAVVAGEKKAKTIERDFLAETSTRLVH